MVKEDLNEYILFNINLVMLCTISTLQFAVDAFQSMP